MVDPQHTPHTAPDGLPPMLNLTWILVSALAVVSNLLSEVDFLLGIATKIISIAGFVVMIILNYKKIIGNSKEIIQKIKRKFK